MANEGSTKATYEELEQELAEAKRIGLANLLDDNEEIERLTASLARVRGLLQRQWISVEERLPDDYGQFLVFATWLDGDGDAVYRVTEASWCMDEGWRIFASPIDAPPTHWRELPDPPEPESKECMETFSGDKCIRFGGHPSKHQTRGGVQWLPHQSSTFPQSSSLVSQGAESADIGKLDTADKKGEEA